MCINSASDADCVTLSKAGECSRNPRWMQQECARSCGVCKPCADLAPETDCIHWANSGECTRNAAWMKEHCALACGACRPCANTAKEQDCIAWARLGECSKNEAYMKHGCALQCGFCNSPEELAEGTTPTDAAETPRKQPGDVADTFSTDVNEERPDEKVADEPSDQVYSVKDEL